MDPATDNSLRERLVAFLAGLNGGLRSELTADTSLLKSGLYDSSAIVNLAEWIQNEVGPGVDLLQFDLAKEWETVADIERFVRQHRASQTN